MSGKRELFEKILLSYEEMLGLEGVNKEEIESYMLNCKIGIKKCEYEECNHLWVSLPSEDEFEDRLFGCVKCGFTNGFIPKYDKIYDELSLEEKAAFEHMTMSRNNYPGMHSDSWCDLELGMAIYKKIVEAHPKATDEQIADYLSYALWKMRTKDQSEKRKLSRVRRLGLKHDFNAWNPEFEQD